MVTVGGEAVSLVCHRLTWGSVCWVECEGVRVFGGAGFTVVPRGRAIMFNMVPSTLPLQNKGCGSYTLIHEGDISMFTGQTHTFLLTFQHEIPMNGMHHS